MISSTRRWTAGTFWGFNLIVSLLYSSSITRQVGEHGRGWSQFSCAIAEWKGLPRSQQLRIHVLVCHLGTIPGIGRFFLIAQPPSMRDIPVTIQNKQIPQIKISKNAPLSPCHISPNQTTPCQVMSCFPSKIIIIYSLHPPQDSTDQHRPPRAIIPPAHLPRTRARHRRPSW
jgi:hypothetical protein